jgi:hypothetical protein
LLQKFLMPDLNVSYSSLENVTPLARVKSDVDWESEIERIKSFQVEDLKLYDWVANKYYKDQRSHFSFTQCGQCSEITGPCTKNVFSARLFRNTVYKPLHRVRELFMKTSAK